MCEILIFGGTTEGRKLAEFCAEKSIDAYISVATDYGEKMLEPSDSLHIITGRMDEDEISEFIKQNSIKLVADATHPYAVKATENIVNACRSAGTEYIRVIREESRIVDNAYYFDDIDSLVEYLSGSDGNILITTGSRELEHFCAIENYSQRCAVRVLKTENIIEHCIKMGFLRENIIAEKPPFTAEQTVRHLNRINAAYLVTKESGSQGGFEDKAKAANETGADLLVLKRPDECGSTLEEVKLKLSSWNKLVSIVGIGTDGDKTLTIQGREAVTEADVIIGAKRITDAFDKLNKPAFVSYDPIAITNYILNSNYNKIAVLMSGDCGFYSGTRSLLKYLKGCRINVVSGISSAVYFSAKIGIPWSDMHFVSLHGKTANIVRAVRRFKRTFFLMGGSVSAKDVCKRLCEYEMNNAEVYIGENLSLENERVIHGTAADFVDIKTGALTVMTVINPNYERSVRSCIPDTEFIRGSVPMTKAEVRSLCTAKLEIGDKDICWDIGSGTGSAAVEMAIRCIEGSVFAVERNIQAVELIDRNRRKFGCDNIEIIHEDAVTAVQKLPSPDCVFIGGSGGELENIIKTAAEKNRSVKIAVTAVSIETLSQCTNIFNSLNMDTDITQVAVTRTSKAGSHTMLKAENPIFIIEGKNR